MSDAQAIQIIEDNDDIVIVDLDDGKKKEDDLSVSDNQLEELRSQLEEEKKNRERAEREAQDARRESVNTVSKLNNETDNRLRAEEVAVANAIAASVAEAERLENEVVLAQESGKFLEAAKLTRQLASAQNKIDSWEAKKVQLESYKEQQKNNPVKPQVTSRTKTKSEVWIENHPEFHNDSKFHAKTMAAHYQAIAEGKAVDTDEYIRYIDDAVSGRSNIADDSTVDHTQTRKSNKTSVSTPPSRNNSMSNRQNNDNNSNRLTREEAEIAQLSYPKLSAAEAQKKYYDSKTALVRSGRISGGNS